LLNGEFSLHWVTSVLCLPIDNIVFISVKRRTKVLLIRDLLQVMFEFLMCVCVLGGCRYAPMFFWLCLFSHPSVRIQLNPIL
jgi:hypothetical protein